MWAAAARGLASEVPPEEAQYNASTTRTSHDERTDADANLIANVIGSQDSEDNSDQPVEPVKRHRGEPGHTPNQYCTVSQSVSFVAVPPRSQYCTVLYKADIYNIYIYVDINTALANRHFPFQTTHISPSRALVLICCMC